MTANALRATPACALPEAAPTPLRIAFLSYRSDPRVGGQGVFVRHVAGALARAGHQVTVLSGPPYPDLPEGVALQAVPSLDLFAQPKLGRWSLRPRHLRSWTDTGEYLAHVSGKFMEPWSFGRRAARWLAAHRDRFDVALDNQCLADGLLDIEAAGLPVVGIIHHPIHRDLHLALAAEPDWGKRWLLKRWYGFLPMQERVAPRLRRIVTVSEASARDIVRHLGVARERITVVPAGVDKTFGPQPQVERLPNRLVTTASADVPLKGLRFLLEAFATLAPTRPQLELVVVGKLREGPSADLVERLGLGERLRFVSGLTDAELAALFASATVAVTPSLYEGFGLPAAEAMACGAPVVVTDGGALPEVVGEAGVVVPAGDAPALADALAALLDDPVRRARLSAAGLARAERYDWDALAGRYGEVLMEAMAC